MSLLNIKNLWYNTLMMTWTIFWRYLPKRSPRFLVDMCFIGFASYLPGAFPFPDCGRMLILLIQILLGEFHVELRPYLSAKSFTNNIGRSNGVEDAVFQTESRVTTATCAKCVVFLSCKHAVHYDCIDISRRFGNVSSRTDFEYREYRAEKTL